MKGHPRYGANPLIQKLMVEAQFAPGAPTKCLWKLQRARGPKPPEIKVEAGRVVQYIGTPHQAKEWAAQHPGWDLVPA